MAETVETAVYKLRVEGQAEIDRLTKSVGDLAVAEEKAGNSTRTFSDALQKQVARVDPLVRAQQQYQKALETNLRFREEGKGTEAQLSAQLEASTRRYQQQVAVINQVEKATVSHTNAQKLQGYQMLNLSRQLQDVGVSLVGGMSPFMVLAQQLPQIADISQASGVSMKNMFLQAAEAATSFLSPVRLAIGAVATLAAGVGYLASQWNAAQREARLATAGIGGASGTSVGDINRFAQRESSYGGLTTGEARAAAIELTRTGDIVIDKLHGVGEAIHGFAALTNTEAASATRRLAQALSGDLVKGMDDLNKATGDFNARDRDFIASLQAAGKETEARQFMIDKMSNSLRKAAAETGFWTDQWNRFSQAVSSAFENMGKALSGPGIEEQLKRAKAALDELEKSGRTDIFANEIDNLKKKVAELNAELEKNAADSYAKQMNRLSSEAQAVTEKLIPQIAALREAQNELAKLQEAREAGQGDKFTDILIDKLKAYTEQLGKATTATGLLATETAKTSARNVAALGDAATAAEKAQARIDALSASFQNGEIAADIYARAVANIRDQLSALSGQGIPTAGLEQMQNTLADITKLNKGNVDLVGDMGRGLKDVGINGKVLEDSTGRTANNVSVAADNTDRLAASAGQAAQQFEQAALAAQKARIAAYDMYKYGVAAGENYMYHTWNATEWGQPTGVSASTLPLSTMTFLQQHPDWKWESRGPSDIGRLVGPGQSEEDIAATLFRSGLGPDPALKNSIDSLTRSTDRLNATNQELLSPYYTQDPRTSHIGFRSQGMALGGYVDVPGGISGNDNMIATIPVASGERIYIDPMNNRRGTSSGSGVSINISSPVYVQGNVNRDEFGRTLYQSNQNLAKQIMAATGR